MRTANPVPTGTRLFANGVSGNGRPRLPGTIPPPVTTSSAATNGDNVAPLHQLSQPVKR